MAFGPNDSEVTTIGNGARLVVDVEFGRGRSLYALSQVIWDEVMEGSPALPNTGSLLKVEKDGTFTEVIEELDRPTSMEFVKNTAYIITLSGEVRTIEDVGNPPFRKIKICCQKIILYVICKKNILGISPDLEVISKIETLDLVITIFC